MFFLRSLFDAFHQFLESFWVVGCHIGEHFAVQSDAFGLELVHEGAVLGTKRAKAGIDLYIELHAHQALFALTFTEGRNAGLDDGGLGELNEVLAAVLVATDLGHDVLASFDVHHATFYTGHSVRGLGVPSGTDT